MAATGDPAFGIKVASHIKQTTFHALSYGLSASSTLKEAFERVQRYCHVASDAVEYEFSRSNREYHFVIEPADEVADESVDALVAAYLRMCRSLIGHDYSPLRIEFRRMPPARGRGFSEVAACPAAISAPLELDWCSMPRPSSVRWTAAIRNWPGTMMRSRFNTCPGSSATIFKRGFAKS